jgi:hypothetical protein
MPPLSDPLLARPLLPNPALAGALGREPLRPRRPEREIAQEVDKLFSRPAGQRTKIWEFGTNLHCSIIGTCLSTAELRQVLLKLGHREAEGATEHDLHASGVLVAGKHQVGAKLLHKALDRRHRLAISRFDRAKSADKVRSMWREAVQCGDIPGAYWATLTHPATNDALTRDAFADVHMLSHLVGAANRADIRRLVQLEKEKADLDPRLAAEQRRFRGEIAFRDRRIGALEARVEQLAGAAPEPSSPSGDVALVTELKSRLARCETHCERIEQQLVEGRTALAAERDARGAAEAREIVLRQELEAIECALLPDDRIENVAPEARQLAGLTLLYVGGRPATIGRLCDLAERAGAIFLYHDGGIEERGRLLAGLVSRADTVLFPVDCISHTAMLLLKRLCRQASKKFVPLRGAGLAPFCAALSYAALRVAAG